jgi:hypothetical protein
MEDESVIDLTDPVSDEDDIDLKDANLYEDYMTDEYTLVIGADIGETEFYVVVYCVELKQGIDVISLRLRNKGQILDIYDLKKVLHFKCKPHAKLWNKVKYIIPEFQYGSATSNTLEVELSRIVGFKKCKKMHVHSMRKAFESEFPKIEGSTKYESRKQNKQNAVKFGRQFFSNRCQKKMKDMKIYDKHDPYDALLFAKCFCEFKMNK